MKAVVLILTSCLLLHFGSLIAFAAQGPPAVTEPAQVRPLPLRDANVIAGHVLLNLRSVGSGPNALESLNTERRWVQSERRSELAHLNELSRSDSQESRQEMQTITQQISVLDDYGANIDDIVYTILITGQLSNQFKLTAAIAVSIALIFFVAGYFFLASREAGIRGTLFGDSGLQFAALFSIIVAIILFGILNILEGKELAALLGGLSGYILGRGSMGRASAGNGDVHKS